MSTTKKRFRFWSRRDSVTIECAKQIIEATFLSRIVSNRRCTLALSLLSAAPVKKLQDHIISLTTHIISLTLSLTPYLASGSVLTELTLGPRLEDVGEVTSKVDGMAPVRAKRKPLFDMPVILVQCEF